MQPPHAHASLNAPRLGALQGDGGVLESPLLSVLCSSIRPDRQWEGGNPPCFLVHNSTLMSS